MTWKRIFIISQIPKENTEFKYTKSRCSVYTQLKHAILPIRPFSPVPPIFYYCYYYIVDLYLRLSREGTTAARWIADTLCTRTTWWIRGLCQRNSGFMCWVPNLSRKRAPTLPLALFRTFLFIVDSDVLPRSQIGGSVSLCNE